MKFSETIRSDLSSGLVVFLVALPLCLGIALASGAPFFSGMIAGVVGGVVVGLLSNSHVSVSGPAAGLTTIVLAGIASLGSFETFLVAVVLAGGIQLGMGALKIGGVAEYFPNSVIKGMLAAIGVIIIIKQLPHALGFAHMEFVDDETGLVHVIADWFQAIHPAAALTCLLSLGILWAWDQPAIKQRLGVLPGGLVVVLVGIGLNALIFPTMPGWLLDGERLVSVPVAASFSEFSSFFASPDFSQLHNSHVYIMALTLAIVASIETLLSVEAADRMDTRRRVTNTDRELMAQGVGNIVSGLLGGLPVTSVIVRSSANVQAQAKTKASTIIHGVLLAVTVVLIPDILNRIPLSSLAAVLLMVGYKLCKPKEFWANWSKGLNQFLPFITTVVMVVGTDLLKGVAAGVVVSLFLVLRKNLQKSYFLEDHRDMATPRTTMRLAQELSFLKKAAIRRALDQMPEGCVVTIDASHTHYMDHDVREIIEEFIEIKAPQRGITCQTYGFNDRYGIVNTIN